MKLIYHSMNGDNEISAFDEAIVNIVKNNAVRIVCPYLGLGYLQKINELSASWQLITDAEEWISSYPSHSKRKEIVEFIKNNRQNIRHIKQLHAKVILTQYKALIGSANFTQKGIFERVEMSVLIDEKKPREELQSWFNALWAKSDIIDSNELNHYIQGISEEAYQKKPPLSLTSTFNAIYTKPKIILPYYEERAIANLVTYLKFAPNRKWLEDYLNLIKLLLNHCKLENGDKRLVMTTAHSNAFLPVTINARYVLAIQRSPIRTMAIYGYEDVMNQPDIKALITEETFSNGNRKITEPPPFCIRFHSSKDILNSALKKKHWLIAAHKEIAHGTKSPYSRYHNKLVYELAVNTDFRSKIIDSVFPV